ncbi:class I SAM-dependent methyltransferase [Roseicella frigidaeris]|uniref:SAM-dependent methyltransferase n=1 Tax=Roseicella frigidaeris TaxID=2230885 RepID=A0A327M7J5_9PROT|nr:class I SAM-dependent methyltransferase [Roseicella frigidaeris]RAI56038.1 SAM-dependent methyltransferase [Roseicella frigidaeris]
MASPQVAPSLDQEKLDLFLGRFLGDLGAMMNGPAVLLGDRLGYWRCLAESGPIDSAGLARRTGTAERAAREWLAAQAAAGYLDYDPRDGRYSLPPEQAAVLADDASPVYLGGFFEIAASAWRDEPRITESYRHGRGLGWHERDGCLFCGTERFFATSYRHLLAQQWLPALDGILPRLERGARIADIGCGHGASTLIMARAFPQSRFEGFDYHAASVAAATEAAARAGLADRAHFTVARAKEVPGQGLYDLVCLFDCLHDMGDPVGAAAHLRGLLRPDGMLMVVEPRAGDRVEDNLNPVGRVYYAASALICTPASMAQEVGAALGAQAGPARLRAVLGEAGFGHVRLAAETPFNMVIEARP